MKIINKILTFSLAAAFSLPVASSKVMAWDYQPSYSFDQYEMASIQLHAQALENRSKEWAAGVDRLLRSEYGRQIPASLLNNAEITARNLTTKAVQLAALVDVRHPDYWAAAELLKDMQIQVVQVNSHTTNILTRLNGILRPISAEWIKANQNKENELAKELEMEMSALQQHRSALDSSRSLIRGLNNLLSNQLLSDY